MIKAIKFKYLWSKLSLILHRVIFCSLASKLRLGKIIFFPFGTPHQSMFAEKSDCLIQPLKIFITVLINNFQPVPRWTWGLRALIGTLARNPIVQNSLYTRNVKDYALRAIPAITISNIRGLTFLTHKALKIVTLRFLVKQSIYKYLHLNLMMMIYLLTHFSSASPLMNSLVSRMVMMVTPLTPSVLFLEMMLLFFFVLP